MHICYFDIRIINRHELNGDLKKNSKKFKCFSYSILNEHLYFICVYEVIFVNVN